MTEVTGLEYDPSDWEDHVLFLHGRESGPHGSKYETLRSHFSVDSPNFEGMDIFDRLEMIEDLTKGMEDLVIVGSSYGGLLAALLYSRHPERIKGYVLMAPALHYEEALEITAMPDSDHAFIIHGTQDEVVPLSEVKVFCAEHGIEVIEVEDSHRLRNAHDSMVEKVDYIIKH